MHYQLPLCFVLVSMYLRLYLAVLSSFVLLDSCLTDGNEKVTRSRIFFCPLTF